MRSGKAIYAKIRFQVELEAEMVTKTRITLVIYGRQKPCVIVHTLKDGLWWAEEVTKT